MRAIAVALLGLVSHAVAQAQPSPPPPPPPPPAPGPPAGAATITPATLEKLRSLGTLAIEPKVLMRNVMARDGAKTVSTSVKLCVSTSGAVVYTEIVKPSSYEAYDLRVRSEIADWMFHPYKEKPTAKALPACTTVAVTYRPPTWKPPATGPRPAALEATTKAQLAALRGDVDMICGAAAATGGSDFMSVGPHIAERMKTDLLADLFATIRTTTTLEMVVDRIWLAMDKTSVKRCATIDVLVKHSR